MDSSDEDSYQRQRRPRTSNSKNKLHDACILNQVYKVLSSAQLTDHNNLSQTRSSVNLRLLVIEKKPLYVSDRVNCIQAIFKPNQIPAGPNPFNQLATQFYAHHAKPQLLFNCHDQIMQQETPPYPSAYHPAYFYKNYQVFKQKRNQVQILENCQVIEVKKWSIAIVNVSKSGYYAPILMIHEWTKNRNNQNIEKLVQNILFEKKLSAILDDFRIKDIKKADILKPRSLYSISYYMRNHLSLKKAQKTSKFVNLDFKGNLLKTNEKLPLSIIPLGSMSEYNIFKRPVPQKYLCERKKINLNKYIDPKDQLQIDQSSQFSEVQFSQVEQGQIQNGRMRRRIQIQGVEIQQNINEASIMRDQYQIQQESQEDEDEMEDFLKSVYKKTMQNSKIV